LEMRNTVLAHWMRRPVGRAVRETVRLAGTAPAAPEARAALRDVLRDTPRAVLQRRRLPARVEQDLRVLEGA
ncbi:MAG: glycosyltransferase family 2 protein, partial [Nocardiopsaceae bacterium]|nr:glycosyltransferase family 2 protein [Nocardiopsaceae bacterium]